MSETTPPLSELRRELDEIDAHMLTTAARRNGIVRQIAEIKARSAGAQPLFDRAREREVYARAADVAAEVGLPAQTAHQLMQAMVESSHRIQEDVSRQASRAAAAAAPRRLLIVGGAGRMGQRLGEEFGARGHGIDMLEANDGRDRRAAVERADIIMLAVPMDRVDAVAEELAPHVKPSSLLCDINSLKERVCATMARACPGEVMGLHPMFGPSVHSLRRQKVVVCPVRRGPLSDWLERELQQMGIEIIESDPASHDRMMAVVQILVHFSTLVMGEALRSSGVGVAESLRYTSPIYRLELAFVGRLFAQSPELYAEIVMTNPQGADAHQWFLKAARRLSDIISRGDRAAFRNVFRDVSAYFSAFADDAMQLSDRIIDVMVTEP